MFLGQWSHARLGRKETVITWTRLLWLRIMLNATLGFTLRGAQKVSLKHIILMFYVTIPDIKNLGEFYCHPLLFNSLCKSRNGVSTTR